MKRIVYGLFILAAAACVYLLVGPSPFAQKNENGAVTAKTIIPRSEADGAGGESSAEVSERLAFEDASLAKISLGPDEIPVTVLNVDADGDAADEQFIAVKENAGGSEAISLIYVDFDEATGGYRRVWSGETGATRSRTFTLFAKDLVGDRSICIVASGMNDDGEQTLTAFRITKGSSGTGSGEGNASAQGGGVHFDVIAAFKADGSISIQESPRSEAYQLGIARGASFPVAAYERDQGSSNMLDQIETTYRFDDITGRYERAGTARIPGAQIEQRRVRELLDGTGARFEEFLDGLWYAPTSSVPGDDTGSPRYVLFDVTRREIIFYVGDVQEVFTWPNSSPTRYGLYVSAQNVSVATLKRVIDIELEGTDSIRLRTFEDVRLKIGISGRWDGSYRKLASDRAAPDAETPEARPGAPLAGTWTSDPSAQSGAGLRMVLRKDGSFESSMGSERSRGRYAMFMQDTLEILELRPESGNRSTFSVVRSSADGTTTLSLREVRLGVRGAEQSGEEEIKLYLQKDGTSAGTTGN